MLRRMVIVKVEPKYLDASDALAVAICHHFQTSAIIQLSGKKVNGWEDFVAKNPQRVKKAGC